MKAKVLVILAMMVLGACGATVNSSKYIPPEGAGNAATGSIFGPPADTHRFEAQKIITAAYQAMTENR